MEMKTENEESFECLGERALDKAKSLCNEKPYSQSRLKQLSLVAYTAVSEMMGLHLAASGQETPSPDKDAEPKG
jgi:hypothetical protein